MSNTGVFSAEYRQMTQFAERLEKAVEHAENEELTRQERVRLATTLRSMADLLDPLGERVGEVRAILALPPAVVRRLRDQNAGADRGGLGALAERILASDGGLAAEDVDVLKTISKTAEYEAAQVYARMIRD